MVTAAPRSYYSFTVNGDKYAVSLKKSNYTAIDTILGLTVSEQVPDDATIVNVSQGIVDLGVLAPIKLNLQSGAKKRQAFVFCALNKVEEAMHPTNGLKGKRYGTWVIKKAYFEMDRSYVP